MNKCCCKNLEQFIEKLTEMTGIPRENIKFSKLSHSEWVELNIATAKMAEEDMLCVVHNADA